MIGKTNTICTFGYQTLLVQVEVDIIPGTIGMQIVGLGDNAIKESRERIRSAIIHSGFEFPVKYIVVNLAPNEKRKEGAISEFAICAAILIASGQLPQSYFVDKILLGSISLDGKLQNPFGLMGAALHASQLKSIKAVIIPEKSLADVGCIPDLNVYSLECLGQLNKLINNQIQRHCNSAIKIPDQAIEVNMSEISGLEYAKKALAYSAIGKHHMMMIGAPGSGKTMLARAFRSILPQMNRSEILSTTHIYSTAKLIQNNLVFNRPFRSPHHTTSGVAMVGGGSRPMPGEVSLAHNGVLFLDELMEFSAATLQALREPMEDRIITISRASGSFTFPANFQLLAATNPCRCGYYLSTKQICSCTPQLIYNLYRKILGPFLDRISIEVEVRESGNHQFINTRFEKNTNYWRSKITEARNRMFSRNGDVLNSELSLEKIIPIYQNLENYDQLIRAYSASTMLSNRGLLNTLRTAVSIMDFNESSIMRNEFLEEAFGYRIICHIKHNFINKVA
ncbi:MAG: YifB family Mg chelatase-like AAA ATPase [Spirochaetia bacterium]|nr:YifB family Mg chelatase-like AAA ATPase [Spirochaetia bacterium]